jgi:hypothetical protein
MISGSLVQTGVSGSSLALYGAGSVSGNIQLMQGGASALLVDGPVVSASVSVGSVPTTINLNSGMWTGAITAGAGARLTLLSATFSPFSGIFASARHVLGRPCPG